MFSPSLSDVIYCVLEVHLENHFNEAIPRSIPRLSQGIALVCHKRKMSRIWAAGGVTVWQLLPQKHWGHPLTVSSGLHSRPESLPVATLRACGATRMCVSQPMMRVSEPMLDMDMGNYSEVLDPTYTTLEFDTMQILYNSNGEFIPS